MARTKLAGLLAIVAAGLVMAPAPASAAGGVSVSLSGGQLQITGDAAVDHVAIVTVTPEGSNSPDLVLGDVTAGVADPIPSSCFRVDPTIIRCPQSSIGGITIDLGPGNDTLSAKGLEGLAAFTFKRFLTARLGAGNDVAVGAPAPNLLSGGPGRDMLMGGPFADELFGGGQNDFLVGQSGRDLFQCGNGPHDLFNDGPGKDLVNIRACEKRVHREFVP
jgi:hypothetical protein